MLERDVESKLKRLEAYGFDVLKLRTPGKDGAMDRLILAPTWSPAPPAVVEIKRPGKYERALQAARRDNWRARGVDVRDMCNTVEQVHALCDTLLVEACNRWMRADIGIVPVPPAHIQSAYAEATGLSFNGSWTRCKAGWTQNTLI